MPQKRHSTRWVSYLFLAWRFVDWFAGGAVVHPIFLGATVRVYRRHLLVKEMIA